MKSQQTNFFNKQVAPIVVLLALFVFAVFTGCAREDEPAGKYGRHDAVSFEASSYRASAGTKSVSDTEGAR